MAVRTLDKAELAGRLALVRVDFNVPMAGGQVSDDTRLRAALPTIARLRALGAKTILLSHFDRPKGRRVEALSLRPVVEPLAGLLGREVIFADDCIGPAAAEAASRLTDGDVALFENLRFHPGEEANDPSFARALAANGDVFVNDAFSAAHRAHASTEGLARLLPAYAGEAMRAELAALDAALGNPRRPVMGIVGGAKVSTKLELLTSLIAKLDRLAIGGGMANTFLAAQGCDVGASFHEPGLVAEARRIMRGASGCELLLPTDVVVAESLDRPAGARICAPGAVRADERIFDAGPGTVERLARAMEASVTLIWNGPLGVFETAPFDAATTAAARHAAGLARAGKLIAVAGGGDTVAALNHAGVAADFTFVSTAGGAFLEWMEGKTLPGVAALERAG